MFLGSAVLEITVGLFLTYFLLALIASSQQEEKAQALNEYGFYRGKHFGATEFLPNKRRLTLQP